MKNTLTARTILALCALITMLPSMAIAQTAAESGGQTFQAPTLGGQPTNTSDSVNLLVNVVNEKNNRYLGDVKISFQRYPQDSQFAPDLLQSPVKIPDPPPPGGFKIDNIKTRQYELIAERKGYKVYNEVLNLVSDKRYTEITIKMTPIVGTPEVNESDLANYQNSTNSYLASNYTTNQNQYPYSSNSAYNPGNNNGGIYNPYNNYPQGTNTSNSTYNQTGYSTDQNTYNPYGQQNTQNQNTSYPYNNTGVGPYGNGQYPYQQTNNNYANEAFTVPIVVNINQGTNYNVNELNVDIYDLGYAGNTYNPSYNAMSNKITLTPQNNSNSNANNAGSFYQMQSLYGCLQPNRSYQITVKQGYNFSTYQVSTSQPVSRNFTSPSSSEAVRINVYPPNGYTGVVQVQTENIPQNSLVGFPTKCPNASYTQTGANGPTTFADPQIYFNNLNNYNIQRMPQSGWYYLVNKTNPADFRQLHFVDRGDSQGGLVFFPATQTAYNQDPPSNTQWYFTGYSRSSNDEIKFTPEVFTKTPMTPDQYAKIVNQTVTKLFQSTTTSSS